MNQHHVKRMVKLAMFEQTTGKKSLEILRFYRRDYVGLGLLVNVLLITIAYLILVGAVVLYRLDDITKYLNELNFKPLILGFLLGYGVILGIYSVIIFAVRRIRYAQAQEDMEKYSKDIKDLMDVYRFEKLTEKYQQRSPKDECINKDA